MSDFNIIKFEGKPFEKLISVISKGIGILYKPTEIRNNADAKAYEIKVIERAKLSAQLEGTKEKFELYSQIESRLLHQEEKRQNNLNQINYIAAKQIENETSVSPEPLDEDWISRFFTIAQDISNQEMQKLWGRILAGEVKHPNTYSLRTLEVLKNLTKREAEVFTNISKKRLQTGFTYLINAHDEFLQNHFQIHYGDILLLREAGLLSSSEAGTPHIGQQIGDRLYFSIGNKVAVVERDKPGIEHSINCWPFTKTGTELSDLIQPEFSEEYLLDIFKKFNQWNGFLKFYIADGTKMENNVWTLINGREIIL